MAIQPKLPPHPTKFGLMASGRIPFMGRHITVPVLGSSKVNVGIFLCIASVILKVFSPDDHFREGGEH
ncbi:hypothetical protein AKO1_003245 [Acrasis kona]|uniref:Uncharacterized protein n=1 Tax=Acrasis kona TaxID=1008807 RepID=A0AAW2Z8W1_9EUKA